MRYGPFLRNRLSITPRYETRRHGHPERHRRIPPQYPQPGKHLLPHTLRAGTGQVRRQGGHRRHQRHRRAAHAHEQPPGPLRHRHRSEDRQPGGTGSATPRRRRTPQRVQQRQDKPHGAHRPAHHQGQELRGRHRKGVPAHQGLMLHAPAHRGRHHRRTRRLGTHTHRRRREAGRNGRHQRDVGLPQPGLRDEILPRPGRDSPHSASKPSR